jgi:3-phenylpropionate/trans-cinnamate dioxygenase ferredoxin reductase subunit
MERSTPGVVIVGAGHAGGTAASVLRQYGWAGAITLVGEEPHPPYQRPPLSKAWLKNANRVEDLALRPAQAYRESEIDLRLGVSVVGIDAVRRMMTLSNGEILAYDKLILAVGATPRKLSVPGADLQGILELRTLDDADRLKAVLGKCDRLAIIGGGYVGLEVAASARALETDAVVIEREQRVLARVACETLSSFFQAYHAARNVDFELSASVAAFTGRHGQVTGVTLADGRSISCDAVLVGVGAVANETLAKQAGCLCDQGVVVDLNACTSVDGIYAIGDCTRRPISPYNLTGRLESVPNALEQAKQAAAHICGRAAAKPEVPWFWSDQYEIKLQIAGLPFHVMHQIVRGSPADAKFAVFHCDAENRIQAVEAVNSPAEFMSGRKLIDSRKIIDPGQLRDLTVSMKEIAS